MKEKQKLIQKADYLSSLVKCHSCESLEFMIDIFLIFF